jgi:hypothetical protein
MFKRLVTLDFARHAGLRVRPVADFGYARELQMAIVMQSEIRRASALYPIVFVEDRETDGFRPVALFGLAPGQNAFVDPQGRWRASYVPAVVRAYPFALARGERADRFLVCVDEASPCVELEEAAAPEVSKPKGAAREGAALFLPDGQPAPALEEAKGFLARLRQMQLATDVWTRALAERNLLTPLTVRASGEASPFALDGCFVVNEERLDGLPLERFAELRDRGWLPSIYAHLASLLQFERLEATGDDPAG